MISHSLKPFFTSVESLAIMPASFNQKDAICIVSAVIFPRPAYLLMEGRVLFHGHCPLDSLQHRCFTDMDKTFSNLLKPQKLSRTFALDGADQR